MTDEGQAHALIRRAKDELGRVDILVNNAGVMQLSKIEKGLSDEWRTMFDVVNVMGLLHATDAAVQVVNISSVAGHKTRPGVGAYSGTKFAVNAISEALRQELIEDKVRVTVVERGQPRQSSPATPQTRRLKKESRVSTGSTSSRPRI